MSEPLPPGHWLETLIEEYCDGSDFHDGDDVLGYLSGTLARETGRIVNGWIFTIQYDPASDDEGGSLHPPRTERYRVMPLD